MADDAIVWRSIILNGHEYCRILHETDRHHLIGAAVFSKNHTPTSLDYFIECDAQWRTISTQVSGWVGEKRIDILISVKSDGRWVLNGEEHKDVEGCIDVDLNFSPSTNLLPIRRLNLEIGQDAEVTAAWLRFPGFKLEPLKQTYRRLDLSTYRYESGGGTFVRDLSVNSEGLVTRYPEIWEVEK